MSNPRKLQGDIDKCLKKVAEGVESFEDIWQKVMTATNTNQKDKSEADLKKEIKKLQRLRDQIKGWIANSEVKDKKVLLENRKLIEQQMERFKIVERETKTKAYSKEGLGQAQKIDPATREKDEMRQWLNESMEKLKIEVDQFESEVESILAQTKRKKLDRDKSDRVEELQSWMERHQFHIGKLETILRMFDNSSIEIDQLKNIQESVNYYIESSQEPDFLEDEGLYDDLLEDEGPPISGYPHIPNDEDNGPLSPANKSTLQMQSTAQQLFDERRRGRPLSESESTPLVPPPVIASPKRPKVQTPSAPTTTASKPVKPKPATTPSKPSSHQPASLSLSNGPQATTSVVTSPSTTSNKVMPQTPTRSTAPAYAAAASGQYTSAWSAGPTTPIISHNFIEGSSVGASTEQTGKMSSIEQNHQSLSQNSSSSVDRKEVSLSQESQGSLTNHQTNSLQHKGHERNSSYGSHSVQSMDHLNSPSPSLQSPSESSKQGLLPNAVTSTTLSQGGPQGYSSLSSGGTSNALTVDTTFSSSSQPPISSPPVSNSHSLSSPTPSSELSNGQSSSSSPQQTGTSSQPDTGPSLPNPTTSAARFLSQPFSTHGTFHQTTAGLASFHHPQQPPVHSPIGITTSEVVSDPLCVITTLSDAYSSAPPSMPSPAGSDYQTKSVVSGLSLAESISTNPVHDVQKLHSGGMLNAAVDSAASGPPSELASSSTTTRSEIFQQPLNPLLGVAPLGPIDLTAENVNQLRFLEAAARHLPQPSDSERVRTYLQRNPYPSAPFHCQHPLPHMDSFDFFQRLNTETLFFIFYYMEGTKAQYLAAKSLKKQSWRFHTKYLMWFQRHEEPRSITDEYEMGTYIYFDYEKWTQRKKEGFTFEYRFLEDKDLP